MDEKTLALVGRLPKGALLDAARAHIQDLALAGRLTEARELYEALLEVDGKNLATAKAGRFIAGRFCFRGDFDAALDIYRNFPDAEDAPDISFEKLAACDLIVQNMADARTLEAWEIWRPLGENLRGAAAKLIWARTGEALMNACYKNNLIRLGKEIYSSLLEFASCEATKSYLEKVGRIGRKFDR